MSIAPIIQMVEVKVPRAQAFELFTMRIGEWWPKGGGVGSKPNVSVTIEPHDGGRWFEQDEIGLETQWGKVLAWDPPCRLVLAWQLDRSFTYDSKLETEVEILFAEMSDGGTRVTLEHRNLERFGGDDIPAHVAKLQHGWPSRLADYVAFVDKQD